MLLTVHEVHSDLAPKNAAQIDMAGMANVVVEYR